MRDGKEGRGDQDRSPISKGTGLLPPPGWADRDVLVASAVGDSYTALLSCSLINQGR